MRYAFVFVCQKGEIEPKAALLAASLKKNCKVDHELIAAIPTPDEEWGSPSRETIAFLSDLGVRVVGISNPFGRGYAIGNKLACLDIETTAEKIIFLDSDMVCLTEFHHDARFEIDFNAKPADFNSYASNEKAWDASYRAIGKPVPDWRIGATITSTPMLPYFNAGFVAVRAGTRLGETWTRICRNLDANPEVTNKRPWLDQIALPLATCELGLDIDCLDDRFNYPINVKPLDPCKLPVFCHYHNPDYIRREPLANALIAELVLENKSLARLLQTWPAWAALLKPYAIRVRSFHFFKRSNQSLISPATCVQASKGPNMIITGIPRSGTSYLCSLLNGIPDCAVINEPLEVISSLQSQPLECCPWDIPSVPWGIPIFYLEQRRLILDGLAIRNKIHEGKFIEDTALIDNVGYHTVEVTRPDFMLATKHPIAYLSRISQLRRVMPNATIVACIRHPLDTLASWKTSFPHLEKADVEAVPVGNIHDGNLSLRQQQQLESIALSGDNALRRALFWRHLAELILSDLDRLLLVRYEDLVTNPGATLHRILKSAGITRSIPRISSGHVRTRRANLEPHDIRQIRGICSQVAASLGYPDITH